MKKSIIFLSALFLFGLGSCKKDKKDTTTPPVTVDSNTLVGYSVNGLKDFNLSSSPISMPIDVKKTGNAQTKLTISVQDLPKGVSATVDTKSGIPDFTSVLNFQIDTLPPAKVYPIKVIISDSANNKKTYLLNMTIDSFRYNITVLYSPLRVYKNSTVENYFVVNVPPPSSVGFVEVNLSGLPSGASASLSKTSAFGAFSGEVTLNSGTAAFGTYPIKITANCASTMQSKSYEFQLKIEDSCFRPILKNYANNTFAEDGGTPIPFSLYGISEASGEVNMISFYTGTSSIPYFAFYVNCDSKTIEVPFTSYPGAGYKSISGTGTYTTSPASITLNCVGITNDGVTKNLVYKFNL